MKQKKKIVVYSLTVKVLGGLSPIQFFKGMAPAVIMAFSSASSMGTLPLNLECTEKLGAKRDVASFVLPLEGIAIVAGVDRIFDMGRTVVNITGDGACTLIVSKLEEKKERRVKAG